MNKAELVRKIAEKTDKKQKEIREILEATLKVLEETMAAQEDVILSGFGSFKLKYKKARTGRNPATGEEIAVPENYVPTFSPAKAFREYCEASWRGEPYGNDSDDEADEAA